MPTTTPGGFTLSEKDRKKLGENIKRLREAKVDGHGKSMTQNEMADKMDITLRHYMRLENCEKDFNPSLALISAAAQALGVDVVDLLK